MLNSKKRMRAAKRNLLEESRNLRGRQLKLTFPFENMRPALLHWLALPCLGALLAAAAPSCHAQAVESIYGPLPLFEFHSSFWVNLHHFLYHEARARQAAKEARDSAGKNAGPSLKQTPGSVVTLSAAEQKSWDAAIAYYTAN